MTAQERITLEDFSLDCYPVHPACVRGSVVICPGGGYQIIGTSEGEPVAWAFNRAGYSAFVLHYAVGTPLLGYRPVSQLARAVTEVRELVPGLPLAVCGFSAGGHLAASLGTMWHRADCFPRDTEPEARRPDGLILAYPVITSGKTSLEQLAGPRPEAQQAFVLDRLVTHRMPPVFLWHTVEDLTVPVDNSLALARALVEHRVPLELHLYPRGVHALSLATPEVAEPAAGRLPDPHVATWFGLALGWLEQLFDVDSPALSAVERT